MNDRDVAKGIKSVERDRAVRGGQGALAFVLALIVGIVVGAATHTLGWGLGAGALVFLLCAALSSSYYRG